MATDIIELIRRDHDEFRAMLAQIDQRGPDGRRELFEQVVEELARHEAAEEAIVHRALRDDVEGGRPVAESVLGEESGAEQLMADMDDMDPKSDEFLTSFHRLREEVLEHAEHEETEEHPRLREAFDAQRLQDMGERFQRVKDVAPTRPHPDTPQQPEVRAVAGPIAGAFDRMRDKVKQTLG